MQLPTVVLLPVGVGSMTAQQVGLSSSMVLQALPNQLMSCYAAVVLCCVQGCQTHSRSSKQAGWM